MTAALLPAPLYGDAMTGHDNNWSNVKRSPGARLLHMLGALAWVAAASTALAAPHHEAELVFPLNDKHNHAPGVVECANGDVLVSWYRGSGERSADDVAVYGARRRRGADAWSEPFVMADTPNFPDCNTCMWIDGDERLWLFSPV